MFLIYKSQQNRSLKRDILELLDDQDDFLPMQTIVDKLQYPTLNAVKSVCKDLHEEIATLYAPEEMTLIVSVRGGVKLNRDGVSFQRLTDNESENSITFKLTSLILKERQIETDSLCEQLFISPSTLGRKLRRHDVLLGDINAKISIANKVTAAGDESTLRFLHMLFMSLAYKSIDHIPEIDDPEKMRALTQQILDYLGGPVLENQLQECAMSVYVVNNALSKGYQINSKDICVPYLEHYDFIKAPAFLDWGTWDWQHFLLTFYFSGKKFGQDWTKLKPDSNLFAEEKRAWLATFEKYFEKLSAESRKSTSAYLSRQLQFQKLIPINEILINFFTNLDSSQISKEYPNYITVFGEFYSELENNYPLYKEAPYLKSNALLDCCQITPLNTFTPCVKLFLYTSFNLLTEELLKAQLEPYLSRFKSEFVTDFKEADLILSTDIFLEPLLSHQQLVPIGTNLSRNDIKTIRSRITSIAHQKDSVTY